MTSRPRSVTSHTRGMTTSRFRHHMRSIGHQLHKGQNLGRRLWRHLLAEFQANGSDIRELVEKLRARIGQNRLEERVRQAPERTGPEMPVLKKAGGRIPSYQQSPVTSFGRSAETQRLVGIRPIQNKESAHRFRNVLVIGGMDFLGAAIVNQLNVSGFQEITITDRLEDPTCRAIAPLVFREFLCREEYEDAAKSRFRPFSDYSHIFYLDGWEDEKLGAAKSLLSAASRTATRFIAISSVASLGPRQSCAVEDRHIPGNFRPTTPEGLLAGLFDRHALSKAPGKGYLSLKHHRLFGPGEREDGGIGGLIKSCHRQARAGGQIRLPAAIAPNTPAGRRRFDFIPVEDAARIALFLAQSHLSEGVYEMGTGHSCTPAEFVKAALSAVDRRQEVVWDPALPFHPPSPQPEKASLRRLLDAGWETAAFDLDAAVKSFVTSYLNPDIELGDEPHGSPLSTETKPAHSPSSIPQKKKP